LINPAVTGGGEVLLSTEAVHPTNGFLLGVGDATNASPQSTLTFATAGLSSIRVNQDLVLFSEGGSSSLGGITTTFAQGGITPPPGVIPEPSTLVLLGSGLLGLGLAAGRRLRVSESRDR
jgi:hypothetical protein